MITDGEPNSTFVVFEKNEIVDLVLHGITAGLRLEIVGSNEGEAYCPRISNGHKSPKRRNKVKRCFNFIIQY